MKNNASSDAALASRVARIPVSPKSRFLRADNDPAVVFVKAWKKPIARTDYDFAALANWPREVLRLAWCWELDRELGSGHESFLRAWHEWNGVPRELRPMLHAHRLKQAALCVGKGKWASKATEASPIFEITGRFDHQGYVRIHALEINWRKTKTELLEAFANWLEHGEHEFSPDQQMDSRHKRGKRDTAQFHSYLRELAIYRICKAGIDRKGGGIEMLDEARMLKGGFIDSSNWQHAKDRTEKRLRERIGLLCGIAKEEDGFWKDYFIGVDQLKPAEATF